MGPLKGVIFTHAVASLDGQRSLDSGGPAPGLRSGWHLRESVQESPGAVGEEPALGLGVLPFFPPHLFAQRWHPWYP